MLGLKVAPVVCSDTTVTLSPPLVSDTLHAPASSWRAACLIYSLFQKLQEMPAHPNLCAYIRLARGRHDKLIIVSEHHPTTVTSEVRNATSSLHLLTSNTLGELTFSVLKALERLSELSIVSCNVSMDTIVYDRGHGLWKLADYGLFYMTQRGSLVPFLIGYPTPFCSFARTHTFVSANLLIANPDTLRL